MLVLNARNSSFLSPWIHADPKILVVTRNSEYVRPLRSQAALLVSEPTGSVPADFAAVLFSSDAMVPAELPPGAIRLSGDLFYLSDGDVIRVDSEARISVLYRRNAAFNAFLVTERCNSFCVMCSQPPRDIDDLYRVDDLLKAIPLIDGAQEICITGGEPALLGERLFDLLSMLKSRLPYAAVHVLTNGRLFQSMDLSQRLAAIRHPDLMLGIPLYSDISSHHDFVVQADGAYDETIRGILNLKRCGVRIEIRVVLHRHTYQRLPQLARFLARNLQFVDKVALMGLEVTGFAKSNYASLWIDPVDYAEELKAAVLELERAAMRVSIYNHQLCTLPEDIRGFAVASISDWKREYLPVCATCDLKGQCGGVFATSGGRISSSIAPVILRSRLESAS